MEMGMLAIALGLTAESKDQEITARVQTLTGLENKLRDATGKADMGAAFAVIDGWRDGAAKLTEAQSELAKVRDREEKAAYEGLVRQGEDNAQITPGNRAGVLAKFTTSETLAAYLSVAPRALPAAANAGEKPAGKPPETPVEGTYKGKAWDKLTHSERAELYQADRDLYNSMRSAAQAQKEGSR